MRFLLLALTAAAIAAMATSTAARSTPAERLLGTRPPEWDVEHWMHSPPLTLEALRGRVVLVRWWTGPGCPFCAASAPALNDFHERYRERGLTVIGFYHHKAPGKPDPEKIERYAESLGFTFPLAIDPDWRTLERWWLDGNRRAWTSVSFLLDRDGVIRHIHPGGQYVAGDADHAALESAIEVLLAEGE